MEPLFINVGFGNVVARHRIVAIITPDSAPIKKLKDIARQRAKLIDVSQGRRTRAVIVTDSDHVILSANSMDTLLKRLQGKEPEGGDTACSKK